MTPLMFRVTSRSTGPEPAHGLTAHQDAEQRAGRGDWAPDAITPLRKPVVTPRCVTKRSLSSLSVRQARRRGTDRDSLGHGCVSRAAGGHLPFFPPGRPRRLDPRRCVARIGHLDTSSVAECIRRQKRSAEAAPECWLNQSVTTLNDLAISLGVMCSRAASRHFDDRTTTRFRHITRCESGHVALRHAFTEEEERTQQERRLGLALFGGLHKRLRGFGIVLCTSSPLWSRKPTPASAAGSPCSVRPSQSWKASAKSPGSKADKPDRKSGADRNRMGSWQRRATPASRRRSRTIP